MEQEGQARQNRTTPGRKATRAQQQWDALEKAEPDTPESLQKHLAALEKATKKAAEKLETLRKEALEKPRQPWKRNRPAAGPRAKRPRRRKSQQMNKFPAQPWKRK